jgi:F-type H+-transporting ATPase subunit delta
VSAQAAPHDYAQAIYDLALEGWARELGEVQHALRSVPGLQTRVTEAATPVKERLGLLDSAVRGGLSEGMRRFLGTLLGAGQLDQIDEILVEFRRLMARGTQRRIARVTSAVPLTREEQESLKGKLASKFGADLEFQYEVDPALIGGIRLQVGGRVIDGSVAGKLAAMRDRLMA